MADATVPAVGGETAAAPEPPPTRDVPWAWFVLILGGCVGAYTLAVAPLASNFDAAAHLARIGQIRSGTVVSPVDDDGRAIVALDSCATAFLNELRGQQALLFLPTWDEDWGDWGDLYPATRCGTPGSLDITNTAVNSPVSYTTGLVGHTLGSPFGPATAARLTVATSIAGYLALAALAVRLAPVARPVLFVVALLPTSLRQASTVSADSMPIAMGLVTVALVLRLRHSPVAAPDAPGSSRRRELLALAASAVALSLSKNLYAPMALLVTLVPTSVFVDLRQRLRYCAAVLATVGVAAGGWALVAVARVEFHYEIIVYVVDSELQKQWILHHPMDFLATVVRSVRAPAFRRWTLPGVVSELVGARADTASFAFRYPVPAAALIGAVAIGGAAVAASIADVPRDAGAAATALRRCAPSAALIAAIATSCIVVMYVGEAIALAPVDPELISYMEGRFLVPLLPMIAIPVAAATGGAPPAHRWHWIVPAGALLLLTWFAAAMFRAYH